MRRPATFAADVQRYLVDEPVQACPPSAWYRFSKIARRNRAALITAGLVGLALTAGSVVSTCQAIRATRAERLAREQNRLARQAVNEMYVQVADVMLANVPQMEQVRRGFLEKALRYYEEFAREQGSDPEVRLKQAEAYRKVGGILRDLGQLGQAEPAFRRSFELLEALVAEAPAVPEYRHQLAIACNNWGVLLTRLDRPREAKQAFLRAQDIHRALVAEYPRERRYLRELLRYPYNLGSLLQAAGRLSEAEQAFRQCLALVDEMNSKFSEHPEASQNKPSSPADVRLLLGQLLVQMKRYKEAEDVIRKALAEFKGSKRESEFLNEPYSRQMESIGHFVLNRLLALTDRRKEAEAELRRAVVLAEGLAADYPGNLSYQWGLAECLANLGDLLKDTGRRREAEQPYRRVLLIEETLAKGHPGERKYRYHQVVISIQLLDVLRDNDLGAEEAEPLCRRYLALAEKLVNDDPDNRAYRENSRDLLTIWGLVLKATGRPREAEAAYRRALIRDEELVARYPSEQDFKRLLAHNRGDLGDLLMEDGRHQEAEPYFRLSLDYAKGIVAEHPEVPFNKLLLSSCLGKWAEVLKSLHRNEEAKAAWCRSLALLEKLAAGYPSELDYRNRFVGELVNMALRVGGLEGDKILRRAVELGEKLVADFPADPGSKHLLAIACNNLGNACSKKGPFGEAARLYRRGINLLEQSMSATPVDPERRLGLAANLGGLGDLLRRTGRFPEAEQTYRRAFAVYEGLVRDAPANTQYRLYQATVQMELADLLHRAGRGSEVVPAFRQGVVLFQKLITDRPTLAEPRYKLAGYLADFPDARLRDTARAITLAEEAARLAPRVPDAWASLGLARYRAGDWKGTIKAMDKTLELSPGGDSKAWFFVAMAHWQLRDKDQARKGYDRAVDWIETNGSQDEKLLRFRAEVVALLGVPELPVDVFAGP